MISEEKSFLQLCEEATHLSFTFEYSSKTFSVSIGVTIHKVIDARAMLYHSGISGILYTQHLTVISNVLVRHRLMILSEVQCNKHLKILGVCIAGTACYYSFLNPFQYSFVLLSYFNTYLNAFIFLIPQLNYLFQTCQPRSREDKMLYQITA